MARTRRQISRNFEKLIKSAYQSLKLDQQVFRRRNQYILNVIEGYGRAKFHIS